MSMIVWEEQWNGTFNAYVDEVSWKSSIFAQKWKGSIQRMHVPDPNNWGGLC